MCEYVSIITWLGSATDVSNEEIKEVTQRPDRDGPDTFRRGTMTVVENGTSRKSRQGADTKYMDGVVYKRDCDHSCWGEEDAEDRKRLACFHHASGGICVS